MIKIITFPSDGTVVRIIDSPEGFGFTTIQNPIDGTKMTVGGLGWKIDSVLAVAPGKRPEEKPIVKAPPLFLIGALILALYYFRK